MSSFNQLGLEALGLVSQPENQLHFFHSQLDPLVPLQELYQPYFGLKGCQVFANASSGSSTESYQAKGRQVDALLFPTLRPELPRVFVVLIGVMDADGLVVDENSLLNRHSLQKGVLHTLPGNVAIHCPREPSHFLLHPLNVLELLQVLVAEVVFPHVLLDFLPHFL